MATLPLQSWLLSVYVNCCSNNAMDSLAMTLLGERTLNLPGSLYDSQLFLYSHQNNLLFVNGTFTEHQCELTLATRFAERTGF